MRIRETCMFCQCEVQVNWFSGSLVDRAGNDVCMRLAVNPNRGEVDIPHMVDNGSHAHVDPTAS
jgi:hypothetical protein